jgi:hypothetical protein
MFKFLMAAMKYFFVASLSTTFSVSEVKGCIIKAFC